MSTTVTLIKFTILVRFTINLVGWQSGSLVCGAGYELVAYQQSQMALQTPEALNRVARDDHPSHATVKQPSPESLG